MISLMGEFIHKGFPVYLLLPKNQESPSGRLEVQNHCLIALGFQ
jgi:hypothetical protein